MKSTFLVLALPLTLALACPRVAFSSSSEGVFPLTTKVGDQLLARNGVGLLEWGVFSWDLYRAALYVEAPTSDVTQILAVGSSKQLRMHFSRALTQEQMVKAFTAAFQANAGTPTVELQEHITRFTQVLTAVRKGDLLVASYQSSGLLTIELNQTRLCSVESVAFGELFFRLYVGARPPSEALRRGLLGG
ncbi:MAG: chalcone isomerase family protein [Planctomycetota bacterium]